MARTRPLLLLALLLFLCPWPLAGAQEPGGAEGGSETQPLPAAPAGNGPRSPKELIDQLRLRIAAYADSKQDADLIQAGRLFDLVGLPSGDRDQIGAVAARDLHAIDSRLWAMAWGIPADPDTESPYLIETEYGDVELVRGKDSVWRFSRNTLERVSDMSVAVADKPLRRGAITIPLPSSSLTYLRDKMPLAWRKKNFLLEHWQWLGLLGLIFTGLLLHQISTRLIQWFERHLASKSGVDEKRIEHSMARPIGQVVMAGIWLWGVQFLLLPATMHVVLMAAARLVMMLASVWAVWALVDLLADIWAERARETTTKLDDQLVPLVRRACKIFVAVGGGLWIASTLDFDIGTLLATLGLGGLAFALAAKDTVSNLFGSITILMDRPFQIGDWIRTGDVEGTVETVGFRSVRIRTFYNSVITLPNSQLITASVDNLGVRRYRRVKEKIAVTYATPTIKLNAFIEGIRELVRRHPYTRKDYYHVYLDGLGDSSLDILLYVFLVCPDWGTELREKERLLLDILRLAEELGVEMAFPTQQIHLLQGQPEQHEELAPSPSAAEKRGRKLARQLVDRYTGKTKPPPVIIADKPGQDDDGEG